MAEPVAESRCERCGGQFHCGANDPAPCACTTVTLDTATLAHLRATYEGCLCLRCLAELAAGGKVNPSAAADGR